jgi:tetraacyldisaccharide 4'-kinase
MLARGGLHVLAIPYGITIYCRNQWFDKQSSASTRISIPVISVGNITAGGTGKTPMVEFIARYFRQQQIRVTLVSRGYGSKDGKPNDEALELERKLPDVPHLQNPDRVAAAELAIAEFEAQLILLDDAFQHRRIKRDLDIVLIDATCPFGYGYLLPRGLLREPLRNLKRADLIAITRVDQISTEQQHRLEKQIQRFNATADIVSFSHAITGIENNSGTQQGLSHLSGKRVVAFCGIGNPQVFQDMLVQQGLHIVHFESLVDHHDYQRTDIQRLVKLAETHQATAFVCTHKDLVKIQVDHLGTAELWALSVAVTPTSGAKEFTSALDTIITTISTGE